MAFTHGTNARIWMDGFAASVYLEDVSADGKIDKAETSTLSNFAKTYIPGLEDATIKMKGFFDVNTVTPASTFEAFLNTHRRTSFPVTYVPNGGSSVSISSPAFIFTGFLMDYQIDASVKDAVQGKVEFQSSTGLQSAKVLTVDAVRTATDADGEGRIDGLAGSANGAVAVLSVSQVLGTLPTLDVKLQHSTDDSVWVDIPSGAFAQKTAVTGVTAQYLSVPGTINRYVRAVWTIAGTTPSFTFNVAFRRL